MPRVKGQRALDVSNQRDWHAREVPASEGTTGHGAPRSVSAAGEGDVAHRCQQLERPVCKRSLGAMPVTGGGSTGHRAYTPGCQQLEGLQCVLQSLSTSSWRTMGLQV